MILIPVWRQINADIFTLKILAPKFMPFACTSLKRCKEARHVFRCQMLRTVHGKHKHQKNWWKSKGWQDWDEKTNKWKGNVDLDKPHQFGGSALAFASRHGTSGHVMVLVKTRFLIVYIDQV